MTTLIDIEVFSTVRDVEDLTKMPAWRDMMALIASQKAVYINDQFDISLEDAGYGRKIAAILGEIKGLDFLQVLSDTMIENIKCEEKGASKDGPEEDK